MPTPIYFGQRIGILYLGKIVEIGPTDQVLVNPKHPYTQALIDAISESDPDNLHREKKIRINEPSSNADVFQGCRFRARCPYVIEKCIDEPRLERVDDKQYAACYVKLD